ncbi:hypothetical protein CSC94_22125 [Zhengella mangrovi]|uniref:Dynamin n=1 Tax=Zhengella mangrovi TaxID=1982044 RepID=A0A2G1QH86_9HYPH|nr:hypothetical protein [Zhengella mangrovi]PHP64885.1 hypothetical protein CSC94_22125 [Zhengella mangrovi]
MDDNMPPRRDYRETRVEASSGGSGWLIAGVAIAALVAVGAWIYSGSTPENTVANDGTPTITEQAPTDNTATGSVKQDEPAPAATEQAPAAPETAPAETAPADNAAPADGQPADGTTTTPPAQ